jgi:hypothetical protein
MVKKGGVNGASVLTRGDDYEVAALQRLAELLLPREAAHFDGRAHVREVSCDAGGVGDVVQAQLADHAAGLEQQRERLADAACGAEHGNLWLRGSAKRKLMMAWSTYNSRSAWRERRP